MFRIKFHTFISIIFYYLTCICSLFTHLVVLELLGCTDPVHIIQINLQVVFTRLFRVIKSEDMTIPEYNAITAFETEWRVDLDAVDIAEGVRARSELDK